MKVTLIEYSGSGWPDPADRAATVMIFTKQTRLEMHPGLLGEIASWSKEKKLEELAYMANTIPSSHEFCDYTFLIEGVTRAFTHQLVRSRQWSFAQQTMRVLRVAGWEYGTGPTINDDVGRKGLYDDEMARISETYDQLLAAGASIEDARGILPTNILTNIVGKCNMRTFAETIHKRSSPRTQDEYRQVIDAMKAEVLRVHPWMSLFLERTVDKAIEDLQKEIDAVPKDDIIMTKEWGTRMTKLLDQIRMKT